MLQDAMTQSGVTFYVGTDITSITTTLNKNITTNIDTSDNATVTISFDRDKQSQTFEADIVLIAIGLVANTDLAASANIAIASSQHINPTITHLPRTVQQGIKVDAYLATSAKHIYAIGDCANVMGSYMPYVMPLMNQAKALAKTLADPNWRRLKWRILPCQWLSKHLVYLWWYYLYRGSTVTINCTGKRPKPLTEWS